MNLKQAKTHSAQYDQSPLLEPDEQTQEKPVPIEVKWNLPVWMLRDPGPRVDMPDDDIDWL